MFHVKHFQKILAQEMTDLIVWSAISKPFASSFSSHIVYLAALDDKCSSIFVVVRSNGLRFDILQWLF